MLVALTQRERKEQAMSTPLENFDNLFILLYNNFILTSQILNCIY